MVLRGADEPLGELLSHQPKRVWQRGATAPSPAPGVENDAGTQWFG
jgi:hypothetical protein